MKKTILFAVLMMGQNAYAKNTSWSVKADYIEACSCHLFCPCYFNTGPEGGHHCEFNNAVKIAEGHVGDVKVDGAKFWLSGDLGGDWAKGMQGAVLTFDPAVTPEQQKAIQFLVGKIYPVKWGKVEVDKAPITWEVKGMDAHAKLGDKADVVLVGVKDASGKQSVLTNVTYWGAQKNNGFYLAKGTHHYKGHGYDYTHKEKNGFMIHIESSGNDAK
jgi:hypothetical protein